MMAFASCGSRTAKYTNAIRKRRCVVLVLRRLRGGNAAYGAGRQNWVRRSGRRTVAAYASSTA
jgi:hypothetical protein